MTSENPYDCPPPNSPFDSSPLPHDALAVDDDIHPWNLPAITPAKIVLPVRRPDDNSTISGNTSNGGNNGYLARRATSQGQQLDFRVFPDAEAERCRLDELAQAPDEHGNVLCWRRKRRCSNPQCHDPLTGKPHRFTRVEHELWNCPVCKQDRHCRALTSLPNRGCKHHGGDTPTGFALPQTKTGEYSRHIKVDHLRADFERMLASPQLCSLDEEIALLRAHMQQVIAQYGGASAHQLLKQIQANRAAYKKELRSKSPNPLRLKQLDRELDDLLTQGASSAQVMSEWGRHADRLSRLIESRDRHIERERLTITADKAWMMLGHVEETFRVGVEMIVEGVDENYVRLQCQTLGVDFATLAPERVRQLIEIYREDRQREKRKVLAYASGRFGELAGSGLIPGQDESPY